MTRKQKLELTWIGKESRPRLEPRVLVEDPALSHRAAHRLSDQDIFDNRLIFGDNLLALKGLEQEFSGQIKCVYIDPPFNTKQAFEHYDDALEHSIWLSLMRDRIEVIYRLLANNGSCFVHIDDNEIAYLIAIMDEIFGRKNRISIISFKQSAASGPKAINPGLVTTSNFILYYVKDKSCWKPNRIFVPISRDDRYNNFIINRESHYSEWRLGTLREAVARDNGVSVRELDRLFGSKFEQKMEEFVIEYRDSVVQPALIRPEDINSEARSALLESQSNGGIVTKSPTEDRYFLNGKQLLFYSSKVKLIDNKLTTAGLATTIWDDLLSNNIHKEGGVSFPNAKKPEALIKRILELSTSPGDLVLDSFGGSGTTAAVAHKMRRRWVVIELGTHCNTHIVPRMKSIIAGNDPSGITGVVNWKGGGGFRYFRLAPSLLEKDTWGNWVINKTYNPALLAEALCKLHGFTYEPSREHYWMQGHSSETDFIYVTTQTLTQAQLRALSDDVGDHRSLLVCCSAFMGGADAFANLTLKKIPHSVLAKCEWGKDDYSLNIKNLPSAPALDPEVVPVAPAPAPPRRRGRPPKATPPSTGTPSLGLDEADTEVEA